MEFFFTTSEPLIYRVSLYIEMPAPFNTSLDCGKALSVNTETAEIKMIINLLIMVSIFKTFDLLAMFSIFNTQEIYLILIMNART